MTQWGLNSSDKADSSWKRHLFNQSFGSQFANTANRISTDIGYGFAILDGIGIVTPYHKLNWIDSKQQEIQIGSRLSVGSGINFDLRGSSEFQTDKETSHQVKISGGLAW